MTAPRRSCHGYRVADFIVEEYSYFNDEDESTDDGQAFRETAVHFDTGAIRFDTFDDRAKENSVYVRRLQDIIRAERVLGYFPEIAAFFEGRSRSFVG